MQVLNSALLVDDSDPFSVILPFYSKMWKIGFDLLYRKLLKMEELLLKQYSTNVGNRQHIRACEF
jgi:hypothetical protein